MVQLPLRQRADQKRTQNCVIEAFSQRESVSVARPRLLYVPEQEKKVSFESPGGVSDDCSSKRDGITTAEALYYHLDVIKVNCSSSKKSKFVLYRHRSIDGTFF